MRKLPGSLAPTPLDDWPRKGRHRTDALVRISVLLLLLPLLTACILGGQPTEQTLPRPESTSLPAWDQAFGTADPRWQGGDSISSVPLSPGKILWLFGDTWIAAQGTTARKQAVIIRNSLALQQVKGHAPGEIDFFWTEGPNGADAPFLPRAAPGKKAETEEAWLWPLSGNRVGPALVLFFIRLVPSTSPLGFELNGAVLVRVPNPEDPPGEWRQEHHEIPFFRHAPNGDLFFGAACFAHGGFLYVYGVREDWSRGVEGRFLLTARVPLADFSPVAFESWRFLSAAGWSAEIEDAAGQFDGAATEMSVSFLPGLSRFVVTYTHCGLSKDVMARFAADPWGPWSAPLVLWECPEVSWGRGYFCYAGKAHPELAASGLELIITYAANSYKLEDHIEDPRIYWPRFVRVTFDPAGLR